MRLFFLSLAFLTSLTAAPAMQASRIFGLGKPSARQRQRYAYMLNGRRMRRPHAPGQPPAPAPQQVMAAR